MSNLSSLETNVRLSILNNNSESGSVFGRGIAVLCRGVREKGSLNAAAKDIGMAYSKAWRIIRDTEDALGVELLVRNGAHGSHLTDEGNRLLDTYFAIEKELSQKAAELYKKLLK